MKRKDNLKVHQSESPINPKKKIRKKQSPYSTAFQKNEIQCGMLSLCLHALSLIHRAAARP
jgi:hypothetical protein